MGEARCFFPEKSTLIDCPIPNGQPENIRRSNMMWTEKAIFRYIPVYTYIFIHTVTISERRCHGFEGDMGGFGVMGEKEERNAVIIISKRKKKVLLSTLKIIASEIFHHFSLLLPF